MKESVHPQDRQQRAIFLFIAALAIIDRLLVLFHYGLRYTGTDDVVFWTVAADLAHGTLREPFLYGQNYNLAIESLVAVPLLWLQVPMQVAMPIATAVCAIAPFAAWAWWFARRREWWAATLFVAIPVLLPVEWGLITSMTRGFVNGMAVTALLPFCLFLRRALLRDIAVGATLMLALAANPAALLFCLPFALVFAFGDDAPWRRIAGMLAGALPIGALWLAALGFYDAHPERVLHNGQQWMYRFHPAELIPEALSRLDRYMQWICPVWWPHAHAILYMLVAVCVALFLHRRRAHAWAFVAALITFIIALGFPKIADGTDHILFPYTRMFLALPVLLAWGAEAIPWGRATALRAGHALVVLACLAFGYKAGKVDEAIARQLDSGRDLPVAAVPIALLEGDAAYVAELARRHHFEVIIPIWGEQAHRGLVLSYAGPLIQHGFPKTLFVQTDRRYWIRASMRDAVPQDLLFICGDDQRWNDNAAKLPPYKLVPFTFGKARLIQGNTLPVGELVHRLGFDMGPFPER